MTVLKLAKKEAHRSEQPINLHLVNLDQIVISDKFKHNDDGILLATKKMILINRCALSYFEWVDT